MAVHQAVGISCQRNSGYRPNRVNIMTQGLSTPDPSPSFTHLSIRRGCATTAHYTHHQVSMMVSRNTTSLPWGCALGQPVRQASASAGMRRDRVSPQIRKKEKKVVYTTMMKHRSVRVPWLKLPHRFIQPNLLKFQTCFTITIC